MNEPTSAAQVHQSPPDPSSLEPQTAARPNRLKGMALTQKQQAIWDMKRPVDDGGLGKKNAEIATILGISVPVVNKTLVVIYKKLGLVKKAGIRFFPQNTGIEMREPEIGAAAIEAAADPWARSANEAIEKANEALKAAGLPAKITASLVKRLKVKYAGAVYAAKNLRTAEILEMLGKKIDLCAFYLDDKVLSEASARDIMLGMTALVEKRNLLRGEPTQIVSDLERKRLHELVPLLIQEAQRRGLTVEGKVLEKSSEPA